MVGRVEAVDSDRCSPLVVLYRLQANWKIHSVLLGGSEGHEEEGAAVEGQSRPSQRKTCLPSHLPDSS